MNSYYNIRGRIWAIGVKYRIKVSMYALSLSLSFSVSWPNPILYVLACSKIRAAVHPLHYFWNHQTFLSHTMQSDIVHSKKRFTQYNRKIYNYNYKPRFLINFLSQKYEIKRGEKRTNYSAMGETWRPRGRLWSTSQVFPNNVV